MAKELPFELKLILSKGFPPGTTTVTCGRYQLQPIPTASADGEAVLSFIDTWESENGGSHPEEEATIVARCLSLSIDARVKPAGIRANHIDIPPTDRERSGYPQFYGKCDPAGFPLHVDRVLSLTDDLARQFARAASTYSFGLEFIPSDPTFAFFLLVVSGECLSSQDAVIPYADLHPDRAKCERFCRFVRAFVPEGQKGADEGDEALFTELLKTVYYSHRSGFVHGGREASVAALLADGARSSYLKHMVDGKETRTPGLAWFARVVRGSLLGYLEALPAEGLTPDQDRLSRLAFEKAGLQLKVKHAMERGQVVTLDDVEFR
jgi:hypothetical protein